MSEPLATIILCTYNRRRWLARAIRSALNQTRANLQLIVCRDGGEPIRDIVQDIGDPRIDLIDRENNIGYAASLNECFGRVKGDYVAYLGDDDLFYPQHLEVCIEALEAVPGVGAAYTDLFAVHANADAAGRIFITRKSVDISRDWDRMFTLHYNHVLGGCLVHRAELLAKIGPNNPDVRVLVDWALVKRLSCFTDFVHLYDVTGEFWRVNDPKDSDRISDKMRRDTRVFDSNVRRIRGERPPKPWLMMPDTAILLPCKTITGGVRKLLNDMADHTWSPRLTHVIAKEWQRGNTPSVECVKFFQQGPQETDESAILRCLQGTDADFATVMHPKCVVKAGYLGAAVYSLALTNRAAVAYPLANQAAAPVPFLYRRQELIEAMLASPGKAPTLAAKAALITHEASYPGVPLSFDGGLTRANHADDMRRFGQAADEYAANQSAHSPYQWGNPLWMAEAQARAHIRGGRDDLAMPMLTQLAQDRPTPEVWHLLAGIYRRAGQAEDARDMYASALAMLKE